MVRSPSGSTWRQDTAEVTETTSIRVQADVPVGQVWSVLSDYFGLAGWASAIAHSSAMTATDVIVIMTDEERAAPPYENDELRAWRRTL
jgi:hypothetical protein